MSRMSTPILPFPHQEGEGIEIGNNPLMRDLGGEAYSVSGDLDALSLFSREVAGIDHF
jgi:hypothetical protein